MRKVRSALLAGLAIGTIWPVLAVAQVEDPSVPALPTGGTEEPADDMSGEDIVVTGERERGTVIGNVKPEQQLNAADIRSYGVSSVAELISELAPQTNAGSGTPIVLLNGKRISAFAEIQDIPTEAIMRVDILPEEVALSYGYAPTQKVVNIVLRPRFRSESAEVRVGTTTDGGRENGRVEGGVLRIRNDNRFNLDVKYSESARLLESERDVISTTPSRPFSLGGNVTGIAGGEIDPALSALAGSAVTVAGVPANAATGAPALADFLPGANQATASDIGRYRTLSPSTRNLSVNAVLARALPGGISATVNGRFEIIDSDSLQGLPGATIGLSASNPYSPFGEPVQLYRYLDDAGPLGQSTRGRTGHVGVTLNGALSPTWQWSFTGAYDISESKTRTDRNVDISALQAAIDAGDPAVNPFGSVPSALIGDRTVDRARSTTSGLVGDALLTGSLFELPAGKVTTSIKVGASTNSFESESLRSGIARDDKFSRDIASGQISIDLPVTSRRLGVLDAIGDFALNVNAGIDRLSDFGSLTGYGYGARWTPIPAIRFIASQSHEQNAPTGSQINSPQIVTPNVAIFDYLRGETVFVSQVGGGNPLLTQSEAHKTRLGVTIKPFDKPDLTLTANYINDRTDNPVAGFPTPTPQIEAAFPDRFIRDVDGALVQVDARPINFAEQRSESLRWGFNLSIPLKSSIQKKFEAWRAAGSKPEDRPQDLRGLFGNRPGGQAAPETRGSQSDRERGGGDGSGGRGGAGPGGGGGGPRGPGGRGPGGGGGRLQFALYHTWHLTERILIDPSLPALDLLNGDAVGSSGGQPRHEVQAQFGYTNNGLGARLSANWQSATRVDGALGASDTTLRFGDLATVDLRLFANLGQIPTLVRAHPFLRGSRVSLSVDNLFNARQNVTDTTGATPVRYQPAYLDALGRTISINFRKMF